MTTLHVDPKSGSDANKGDSPAHPLATLAAGQARLPDNQPWSVLLCRGRTFTTGFGRWLRSGGDAAHPGVIGAYGVGAPPVIHAPAPFTHEVRDPRLKHLLIQDIVFDGFDLPRSNGLVFKNCEDVELRGVAVRGYIVNVMIQQGCADMRVVGCTITDSWSVVGHSQGIFSSDCDGLLLDGNTFDHNGWREGDEEKSNKNHNAYITTSNTKVVVRDNKFHLAAGTNLQMRAGGDVLYNLFTEAPNGLTYGVVLGSSPLKGGVKGTVQGNTAEGCNTAYWIANTNGVDFAGNSSDADCGQGLVVNYGNGWGVRKLRVRDCPSIMGATALAFGPGSINTEPFYDKVAVDGKWTKVKVEEVGDPQQNRDGGRVELDVEISECVFTGTVRRVLFASFGGVDPSLLRLRNTAFRGAGGYMLRDYVEGSAEKRKVEWPVTQLTEAKWTGLVGATVVPARESLDELAVRLGLARETAERLLREGAGV